LYIIIKVDPHWVDLLYYQKRMVVLPCLEQHEISSASKETAFRDFQVAIPKACDLTFKGLINH